MLDLELVRVSTVRQKLFCCIHIIAIVRHWPVTGRVVVIVVIVVLVTPTPVVLTRPLSFRPSIVVMGAPSTSDGMIWAPSGASSVESVYAGPIRCLFCLLCSST